MIHIIHMEVSVMRCFVVAAVFLFVTGICLTSLSVFAAEGLPVAVPSAEKAANTVVDKTVKAATEKAVQAVVDKTAASSEQAAGNEEAGDEAGDDEATLADTVRTGTVLPSEPASVARLDNFFNSIQDIPEYYSDRKCRKKTDSQTAQDLIRYKPNFGKKIWIMSHFADSIEQYAVDLGDLYASRTYKMSALEIEENVAPHLEEYLKDKDIDFQKWADTFEKWGRTYVDPSSGGKKRSTFIVKDYRNGNFLILKPRRGKQVCYYIAEKFQEIVNGMLTYSPLAEKKKKK